MTCPFLVGIVGHLVQFSTPRGDEMRPHHRFVAVGVCFLVIGAALMMSPTSRAVGVAFVPISAVWFALAAKKSKTPPPSEPPTPPG